MKRDLRLWIPILLPPTIWFLSLLANFALAPATCNVGGELVRHAVSIGSLITVGAATAFAGWLWMRTSIRVSPAEGAPSERVRAMALAGVGLSAAFLVVIAAQAIPDFILTGCQ